MRENSPVFYDPEFRLILGGLKGAWQVFKHDDVKQIINDYKTYTVEYVPKTQDNPLSFGVSLTDPPRHNQLRALVSDLFTPKAISAMKQWIETIAAELLDKVANAKEMEVAEDLAVPLPIQVIAQILGVPYSDREKFKEWSVAITENPAEFPGGIEAHIRIQQEMSQYFLNMIEERSKAPGDDLISRVIQAEIDGEKLSTMDILGFCLLLLIAGNETTTNLITNTIYALTMFPDVQDHLANHPEDIPKAIEESLRFRSPVQSVYRKATRDVEFGGQLFKEGDLINIWLGSANHDETVFPNPDVFDLNRPNLSHISFGFGIHYCLGAPLARLEAKIVFEKLFQRFHQIRLKPGTVIDPHKSEFMYALNSLPVIFEHK